MIPTKQRIIFTIMILNSCHVISILLYISID
uniref:Uncharacterized protein n=1 Tax=Siphoviridae sp. ctLqe90 TaxID=2825456 RepID=A0A8S5Q4A6_9CAUD|nr:MAG TPA: hypothetical protein [Siphoviridae sp. ctLqe90]